MKKRWFAWALTLCMVLTLFGGCKIETPDEAAGGVTASTLFGPDASSESGSPDSSQSSESESSDTSGGAQENGSGTASQPKDRYQTNPVPEGKPAPTEPQDQSTEKKKVLYCTLLVECKTILNNMDRFNTNKLSVLPADGVVFKEQKVVFYEGESVFDVLNREMKKNRIHMEFRATPMYNSNYIAGINNLYEFDCGELSGWMYEVNGWYPNYGCSRYTVKEGDVIKWRFTCDLGRDIGGDWLAQGNGA